MKIYAGTSGYGYKEWRGTFYPEKISPKEMLRFYSQRLNAVEINNTFYHNVADTGRPLVMGRTGSRRFYLRAQGASDHHACEATEECEGVITLQTEQGPIGVPIGTALWASMESIYMVPWVAIRPNDASVEYGCRLWFCENAQQASTNTMLFLMNTHPEEDAWILRTAVPKKLSYALQELLTKS